MTIFTKEELIQFNNFLLNRGEPNSRDNKGYNKADYNTCSNYYYGLSNSQLADLSNRLIKYSITQLEIDKEIMKESAKHYSLMERDKIMSLGVSILIKDEDTAIGFKYKEKFVRVMQMQPKRVFNRTLKSWVVPNDNVIKALIDLKRAGADVDNAIEYAKKILDIA